MSKHTPGPWRVEDVMGDGPIDVCGPDRPGMGSPNLIATALTDLGVGGDVLHGLSEAIANARLIAAAPELLFVAKEAVHHDEGGPHSNDRIQRAMAAIAKAEGR